MDVFAIFNSVWIQNKLSWSYDGGSCQSNKKYFLTVNNMPNKLGCINIVLNNNQHDQFQISKNFQKKINIVFLVQQIYTC